MTLVGVVLADVGLSIPDYRSGERTFQVLCQVAGRAGREREGGSVVFQTYQPENYAIRAAAAQDFEGFYAAETRYRREGGQSAVFSDHQTADGGIRTGRRLSRGRWSLRSRCGRRGRRRTCRRWKFWGLRRPTLPGFGVGTGGT